MSRMDLTAEFLTYLAKNPEGRIIAREAGVSHEWFLDPIHKKIWGIIGASEDSLSDVYIRAQGGVDFYSVDYTEDLAKLIESFREATRKEELVTACGKASMAADSQSKLADDILRELHQALQGMERFRCPDQQSPLFLKDLQIVYQDYLKRREAGGITGLPYPFPTLSRLTTGLNPAEWVVFYGHAKAMKTWIWLYSALYMWRTNNVPLLITSKEMSAKVCRERFCAVYAGVDYGAILTEAEKEAEIIIWDGGNNDTPFYKPDLHITIVDPHRPGHELAYFPGETNLRMANVVIVNKITTADPDKVDIVLNNTKFANPNAIVIKAASPVTIEDENAIRGKKVLIVEDGPTLTHGEMTYGAGMVAAKKYGAGETIDPLPYLVGEIKETFEKYKHVKGKGFLPAMGYSDQQIADLKATIDATPCDIVLAGTPIDLNRVLSVNKPIVRVFYSLEEISKPDLSDVLKDF